MEGDPGRKDSEERWRKGPHPIHVANWGETTGVSGHPVGEGHARR